MSMVRRARGTRTPRGVGRTDHRETQEPKSKKQTTRKKTSSWRHYYLWTDSELMRVLDPREWTSGVLASSGRVTEEEGGADATQLLLLPYRM